jgi:hypothetical protein
MPIHTEISPREEILPPIAARASPRYHQGEAILLTIESPPGWWLVAAAAALGFVGGVIFTLTQASRPTTE